MISENMEVLTPEIHTFTSGLHPRYLDDMLGGSLLAKKGISKTIQASEEGGRIKKLMGALRYLYRNSPLLRGLAKTCLYLYGMLSLVAFLLVSHELPRVGASNNTSWCGVQPR